MTTLPIRRVLATGAAALAAMAIGSPALASASTHHRRHHHHHAAAIPQHNGGDRDGDNNGAHSDGDGDT